MTRFDKKGDDWLTEQIGEKGIRLDPGFSPATFKTFINGKAYSSDTMIPVASYNPDDVASYDQKYETLYQSTDGSFLLEGAGSFRTPWAKKHVDCNDTYPAHGLLPLTADEAMTWLELRGLVDEYIEIFGDPDKEEDDRDGMLLSMPSSLADRIREAAKAEKIPVQEWVQARLTEALG
jgi:hypothetical protein